MSEHPAQTHGPLSPGLIKSSAELMFLAYYPAWASNLGACKSSKAFLKAQACFPMIGMLQSSCGEAIMCLQLPEQCIWELEMKEYSGGSWHIIHPMHGSLTVVADCLTPGTKYSFRARAGELSLCCSQQSCLSCIGWPCCHEKAQ